MSEIQFHKTVYNVNLYGTKYEMRKPTVREAMTFQKNLESASTEEDRFDRLTDFFVSLGLKKEAIDSMQIDHMVQLAETLSAVDKKK